MKEKQNVDEQKLFLLLIIWKITERVTFFGRRIINNLLTNKLINN